MALAMVIDTSLPFGGAPFHSTAWTVIRQAQQQGSEDRSRALDRLIGVYWRPVYWALRLDWRCDPEDAKDLTQEYFSAFLEKGLIDEVAPERGRFRAYVKATLKNFMLSRRRAQQTLKRGGSRRIVPLEDLPSVEANATARAESPEKRFERELMRAIIQQVLKALEEACAAEGRREQFALFQAYYVEEAAGRAVRYEDLSARFGVSLHDVKNRLAEMRARFRELILDFLRDGVSSEDDLRSEIQEVFEA